MSNENDDTDVIKLEAEYRSGKIAVENAQETVKSIESEIEQLSTAGASVPEDVGRRLTSAKKEAASKEATLKSIEEKLKKLNPEWVNGEGNTTDGRLQSSKEQSNEDNSSRYDDADLEKLLNKLVDSGMLNTTPLKLNPFMQAVVEFSKTGVFFILLGSLMLFIAFDQLSETHSSMTFIVVVLGSAIILYGTGTQGAAKHNMSSADTARRTEVLIAGGAGVMAIVIAAGFIKFPGPIKAAFREDSRLAYLLLQAREGWNPKDFHIQVHFNGQPVPVRIRHDSIIETIVPVIQSEKHNHFLVSYLKINSNKFNSKFPVRPDPYFRKFEMDENAFDIDGTLGLPELVREPIYIEMKSDEILQNNLTQGAVGAVPPGHREPDPDASKFNDKFVAG